MAEMCSGIGFSMCRSKKTAIALSFKLQAFSFAEGGLVVREDAFGGVEEGDAQFIGALDDIRVLQGA